MTIPTYPSTAELGALIERAIGHVVKVILKADDSDGLAACRREVTRRVEAGGGDSFAATYAQERLAVLDGDTEALVGLLGGDLRAGCTSHRPYQFIRVAEAMAELGGRPRQPRAGLWPTCSLLLARWR